MKLFDSLWKPHPNPSPGVGGAIPELQMNFLKQMLSYFLIEIFTSLLSLTCPSNSGGGVGVGQFLELKNNLM
jgi:hypothetical protein